MAMNILSRLLSGSDKPNSAAKAKERLKLVIAHENAKRNCPDFLPQLQSEIMKLLAKYMKMEDVQAQVKMTHEGSTELLQVEVVLPSS